MQVKLKPFFADVNTMRMHKNVDIKFSAHDILFMLVLSKKMKHTTMSQSMKKNMLQLKYLS